MIILDQYESQFYTADAVAGAYASANKRGEPGEKPYTAMLVMKNTNKAVPIGRYDSLEQASVAVGRLATAVSEGEQVIFRMPWPEEVNVQRAMSSSYTSPRNSHGGS